MCVVATREWVCSADELTPTNGCCCAGTGTDTRENELHELFDEAGTVDSVRVVRDKASGFRSDSHQSNGRRQWAPHHSCACVRVRACVRACVCVCVKSDHPYHIFPSTSCTGRAGR